MEPDFMDRDAPNEYYDERHEYYSAGTMRVILGYKYRLNFEI